MFLHPMHFGQFLTGTQYMLIRAHCFSCSELQWTENTAIYVFKEQIFYCCPPSWQLLKSLLWWSCLASIFRQPPALKWHILQPYAYCIKLSIVHTYIKEINKDHQQMRKWSLWTATIATFKYDLICRFCFHEVYELAIIEKSKGMNIWLVPIILHFFWRHMMYST